MKPLPRFAMPAIDVDRTALRDTFAFKDLPPWVWADVTPVSGGPPVLGRRLSPPVTNAAGEPCNFMALEGACLPMQENASCRAFDVVMVLKPYTGGPTGLGENWKPPT